MVDVLCRVDWQAFISLSFPDVRPGVMVGPCIRERMLFAWLRRVGRAGGRSKGEALKYPWAVRAELGEKTGRFHYHPLLGGLDPAFIRDCVLRPLPAVARWWEELGGGSARTSGVFDVHGVVEYFEKLQLGGSAGWEYEAARFTTKQSLLSKHAAALLTRYARRGLPSCTSEKALETATSHGLVELCVA